MAGWPRSAARWTQVLRQRGGFEEAEGGAGVKIDKHEVSHNSLPGTTGLPHDRDRYGTTRRRSGPDPIHRDSRHRGATSRRSSATGRRSSRCPRGKRESITLGNPGFGFDPRCLGRTKIPERKTCWSREPCAGPVRVGKTWISPRFPRPQCRESFRVLTPASPAQAPREQTDRAVLDVAPWAGSEASLAPPVGQEDELRDRAESASVKI